MIDVIETYEELQNLSDVKEDYEVFCSETNKVYIYSEEEWIEKKVEGNVEMSLYEMNKMVIQQLPPLDDEQLLEIEEEINAWRKSNFYLLYGQEMSYFTIFEQNEEGEFENFGHAVIELIKDVTDTIYSIETVEDDSAFEIWVKYEDEATVLYLFDFKQGRVTFSE